MGTRHFVRRYETTVLLTVIDSLALAHDTAASVLHPSSATSVAWTVHLRAVVRGVDGALVESG